MSIVHPIMVSTYEALERALESNWCAIYVESYIYKQMESKIMDLMYSSGYFLSDHYYYKGVMFLKTSLHASEILDPMGIL